MDMRTAATQKPVDFERMAAIERAFCPE